MFVMHAAMKYMVTGLTARCSEFIEMQLDATNAPSMLDQAIFFRNAALISKCVHVIGREAPDVLVSTAFYRMSSEALRLVLTSDAINATEIEIVKACINWAERKCINDQSKPVTGSEIRKALGENIYLLRFPALNCDQFVTHVVPRDILSKKEGYLVFCYLHNKEAQPELPFVVRPRTNPFRDVQLLINTDPPQNTKIITHNTVMSSIMKCRISHCIKLSSILLHSIANVSGEHSVDLLITQEQRELLNEHTQVSYMPSSQFAPCAIHAQDVIIKSGDFEIICQIRFKEIPRQNRSIFKKIQSINFPAQNDRYMYDGSTKHISLSDQYVQFDIEPDLEQLMSGIEYRLA